MKRGFSLAELMMVLAVISIIMGTMNIHFQNKKLQAEAKSIVSYIRIYESALSLYYLRNDGNFPEEIYELEGYLPTGFNDLMGTGPSGFQSMTVNSQDGDCSILISAAGRYGEKLLHEVQQQLETFSIDSQIQFQEDSEDEYSIEYHLKQGETIYI